MTWSVVWTVLPNGFNSANGRARLSLVASPRFVGPGTTLGQTPLARWPTMVAGLTNLSVLVSPTDDHIPATIVSPRPDQALWDRLFAPTTPVESYADDPPVTQPVVTSFSYGPALACLSTLYDQALQTSPTELLRPDHPVAQSIAGLRDWLTLPNGDGPASRSRAGVAGAAPAVRQAEVADLLDPARLTAARIGQAADLLRQRGQMAAATMTPLAPVLHRLRLTGGQPAARAARENGAVAGATGAPAPSEIKTLEQADFHQVVGLLLDHPALALRLGLRLDVEIDPLPGVHTIRMVSPSGMPLDGPVAVPQPWSRVECDPGSRRFIMVSDTGGQSEIANGMLDLRPPTPGKPGGAVVSDLDVVGVTAQLHVLASSLARPAAAGQPAAAQPIALPARRGVGLTVAQVDRRSGTVERALSNANLFQQPGRETVEGAPVLFADDVTGGYRVDLQMDDGPFLSLMRRHVSYHIGASGTASRIPLDVHDEGQVDPIVAVEQYDADGNPHVLIGEELFGFEGWSLSVPRPGLKVVAEGNGTPNVAPVEPAPAPGYPLTMVTRVEPGTLPRLRYGRRYVFRARAVDLAGNSIDPALCDNSLASAPVVYRRYEPVPPPTLVPRTAFQPGESLVRLVVCTDGDGNVLRATCERHVAPPKASQHLAELHGCFDEALGPDTPARAAARARLLEIARREAGSFLDVRVPHPTGPGTVQVSGIAITTNDPVNRPPVSKQPLPRGQALQDGEYVIHDTPAVLLPYLPDPVAAGAAITGLPGVVKVTYSGGSWPDARPFRLVLRPGTTAAAVANLVQEGGIQALNIALPPGAVVETQLTSTLTPGGLDVMSPLPAAQRQDALDGQVPILSPRQPLTLVHAVRRPIEKPRLTFFSPIQTENGLEVTRDAGTTSVSLDGLIECHAATTAQVDVEATWEEIVDRPGRPVVTETRREVAASYLVAPGQSAIPFGTMPSPLPPGVPATAPAPATLHRFGDNRHRRVKYRPVGTTRFREYFPTVPQGDSSLEREGDVVEVRIRNATRPQPPSIHSVVPIFRWDRRVENGVYTSVRKTVGVRVYLNRPWYATGSDELLGVVVFSSLQSGESLATYTDGRLRLARLVSQWGRDPLQDNGPAEAPLLASNFPAGVTIQKEATLVELLPLSPTSYDVDVVGHTVHFDPERDLWYADIEVQLPEERFPFVRLGLTRFQPVSTPRCHLSRVVLTDFFQLTPTRTLTARLAEPDGSGVYLRVTGPGLKNTSFTAEHHRRVVDPLLEPRLDVTEPAPETLVPKIELGPDAPSTPASIVMHGTLAVSKTPGQPFTMPPDLLRGRIVVTEQYDGSLHLKGFTRSQAIYVETFDRDILSTS